VREHSARQVKSVSSKGTVPFEAGGDHKFIGSIGRVTMREIEYTKNVVTMTPNGKAVLLRSGQF